MSLKVLVIDDEPAVRMLLSYALNEAQVQVASAATGLEGLAMLETQPFDALFVDLNLPDMSGEQIVHHAREARGALPIIMMTAEPEHLVPARRNIDAYLNKPFRLASLHAALDKAIATRRAAVGSPAAV